MNRKLPLELVTENRVYKLKGKNNAWNLYERETLFNFFMLKKDNFEIDLQKIKFMY